ncbi:MULTISPECIES: hypothetical protein [Enterobacter]|uniref:hypothetical protein n=1 Tax=Enterobacter TaxID=547 RepID=UPI000461DEBC|nr:MULTISPECIES: hypothetical protein [Enterobacter]KDF62037.1 hypothetical protein AF40_00815 [Enterobacter roggenkampii MGH 54]MCK7466220.1 hypothetical protein [Enterobacter roggenkampii]
MESPKEPTIIANGLNDEQLAAWIADKHLSLSRLRELRESKAELEGQLTLINERIEACVAQATINIENQPATMGDFFSEAERKIKFTSEPGGVNVIYHETLVKALRIELDGLRRQIVMNEIVANQGS